MSKEISRREFNRTAAAVPLFGIPALGSLLPQQKATRLQVQYHRICVDGLHSTLR